MKGYLGACSAVGCYGQAWSRNVSTQWWENMDTGDQKRGMTDCRCGDEAEMSINRLLLRMPAQHRTSGRPPAHSRLYALSCIPSEERQCFVPKKPDSGPACVPDGCPSATGPPPPTDGGTVPTVRHPNIDSPEAAPISAAFPFLAMREARGQARA